MRLAWTQSWRIYWPLISVANYGHSILRQHHARFPHSRVFGRRGDFERRLSCVGGHLCSTSDILQIQVHFRDSSSCFTSRDKRQQGRNLGTLTVALRLCQAHDEGGEERKQDERKGRVRVQRPVTVKRRKRLRVQTLRLCLHPIPT